MSAAKNTGVQYEPIAHTEHTLPGGLRILALRQPHLSRSHVALYVRTGSRFENKTNNGVSHFLEHMLYRGTPKLPRAHDVNTAFESLGGYLYAATHVDYGVFSVTHPPETLSEVLSLFAEVVTQPTFTDIEIEKGIVLEEILEDKNEEGEEIDPDNLSRKLLYGAHALGFSITGEADAVRGFTLPGLRAHHERHYTQAASVLVMSGCGVDDAALEQASRMFSALPSGTPITTAAPPAPSKAPIFSFVPDASSQVELRICFRGFSEKHPMKPAVDLLMRVLDDGMSTRLYHRLCDDIGLCYNVNANYDGYEDDGVLDFAASCASERAPKVTREILGVLGELATSGPDAAELEKAKKRYAWDVRSMRDSLEDLAGFYAGGRLFDRFETPQEKMARVMAVTAEDVRVAAETLASSGALGVVAVGSLEARHHDKLVNTVDSWR